MLTRFTFRLRAWSPSVLLVVVAVIALQAGAHPGAFPATALLVVAAFGTFYLVREVTAPIERIAMNVCDPPVTQAPLAQDPSHGRALSAGSIRRIAADLDQQMSGLSRRVNHDPLTGLANRAQFDAAVEMALAKSGRPADSVAVLFLDLDDFKSINDTHGHAAGDQLLVAVAERLKGCLRAGDTGARVGGDEFTAVLDEVEGVGAAVAIAERLLQRLQEPFKLAGREVLLSTSIGVAIGTPGADRPKSLLRHADLALYRAKDRGKACYELFDAGLMAEATARQQFEADFRRGLGRGEFHVEYQPIVSVASGRVAEVEALLRWNHPRAGPLPASHFLPLAEASGLIVPLGRWAIAEACRQLRVCHAIRPGGTPLRLSVNLSARELQSDSLIDDLDGILRRADFSPANLTIEITESTALATETPNITVLRALKARGVLLALDDFGTGYSSLAYLLHFPIDVLKIDRSFIRRAGQGARDRTILQAIADLARALNLDVTAEGIETDEQLACVRALGCTFAQGYYLARPMPAHQLRRFLEVESRELARRA